MNTRTVEQRLLVVEVVEPPGARERAVSAARAQARKQPSPRRGRRLWAGVAAAVAGAALVVSPPGQALAEKIAELAGIGEAPTEVPAVVSPGSENQSEVVATGTSPAGVPFEVVASVGSDPQEADSGVTCFSVSFPSLTPSSTSASCLTKAAQRPLQEGPAISPFVSVGQQELSPEADLIVTATVSPEIDSVKLTYADGADVQEAALTSAEVTLAPAGGTDADGDSLSPMSARYVVGFVPSRILGTIPRGSGSPLNPAAQSSLEEALASITLSGFDETGELVVEVHAAQGPYASWSIVEELNQREEDTSRRELEMRRCFERILRRAGIPSAGAPVEVPSPSPDELRQCAQRRAGAGG